jgi:thioredoxin reductase
MEENRKNIFVSNLILGGGAAGVQMGFFFQRDLPNDYLILEKSDHVGSFFSVYPVKRELISFNKKNSIFRKGEIIPSDPELESEYEWETVDEINLRWDWNSLLSDSYEMPFTDYSQDLYPTADDLVKYLNDFATRYNLKIEFGVEVCKVSKSPETGHFILDCVRKAEDNTFEAVVYESERLFVGTGTGRPYYPNIKGISLIDECYENMAEIREKAPDYYKGKIVLILGKGNSAFEIADYLLEDVSLIHLASPDTIRFAWSSRFAGNVRANHLKILDLYQLKLLQGVLDCVVKEIKRLDDKFVVRIEYTHADGEEEEIIYDHVIRCTGFQFDFTIFDDETIPIDTCINGRYPRMDSIWGAENVEGMYFIGTTMQVRDFRKSSSAFLDGFRYNVRSLYYLVRSKYYDYELKHENLKLDPRIISLFLLDRICHTSALWTQFGYLCDVLVIRKEEGSVKYYYELPKDYVTEDSQFKDEDHYYVITFEWGPWNGNIFAIERHPDHEMANTNVFLHPIIRRYSGSENIDTFHLLEDLFGMYSQKWYPKVYQKRSGRTPKQYHEEEHEKPLYEFFCRHLSNH